MIEQKRIDILDLTKWLCSLLIILIHATPFEQGSIAHFYIVNILARIAVPLFFAISGYLFFGKITFENGKITRTKENLNRLLHYVKHLAVIYIVSSVFYLLYKIPMWYSIDWWGIHALKDYIVSFFLSGSEYHLWYILASIYGIILFYGLLTFIRMDIMKYLCAGGWVIECLLYSYSWIGIENIEILNWLTSRFSICFDAAFRAVPLMGIGLLCAARSTKKYSITLLIITFVTIVLEASGLYFFSPNDGRYSYMLTTPLFTYCMLKWLLSVDFGFRNRSIPKWMRDTSLIIYIIHPMVIYLLDLAGLQRGIPKWLAVTLLSVAVASAWISLKKHLMRTHLQNDA